MAVFCGAKGNCTFFFCSVLSEFRKAVVAATTACVDGTVVVCRVVLGLARATVKHAPSALMVMISAGNRIFFICDFITFFDLCITFRMTLKIYWSAIPT